MILKDFWGGEAIDCIKKDGLGNRQQLHTRLNYNTEREKHND
ncbi:hypothetical protein Javan140_0014 [Streptococcus phage Javan140]|nr:hypothetical protein Javan140_0014 [Streptococcus phage Javan140]